MARKPEIADPSFKTTSPVWEYFGCPIRDGKPDETQTICRMCYVIIPRPDTGSTTSMRGHIKTRHPEIELSGDLKKPHQQIGASTSNIDMEPMQEAEFSKVKNIMKRVHDEISEETELNKFLKGNIDDLASIENKKELVGVFGRTGAGKSSLINAIIGEEDLLPSGDLTACTSVMIQVQANMKNSKYIAEIEFIPRKEWEHELWEFLNFRDSKKNKEGDTVTDDDDIKEKISALYGKDTKNLLSTYMDEKNFKKIPEFLKSEEIDRKKILECNKSSELSAKIAKYIRRDSEEETGSNTGTRYWPLVKCVTIKVPNASKLLQHVALVDLPGTGDCNKSRDEMWKRFVRDCSAVWIVTSDTSRVDSVKEPWEILNETISLIGNGGECRSIRFICTKCDVIDDKYKKSNEVARNHVLQKNKSLKERVLDKFNKQKPFIEKHFSGDSENLFQVFTVTSKDVNELKYLQKDDTEIPKLQEFVKDLNDRQSNINNYVSGAYGILSLMKAANTTETGSRKAADVSNDLKTRLQGWIDKVDPLMMIEVKEAFETCLDKGVELSVRPESCESILKGVTELYHSALKSLVKNQGIYQKTEVNLNESLSKHLRETIDQEFSKTFPNEGRTGPFKEVIDKFTLDTDSFSDEYELQMTFLKTEEDKLKKKLANVIRDEKKKIYCSLTESIQESMQPCYDKATQHSGPGMQKKMQQEIRTHLYANKSTMFEKAKKHMLQLVENLKDQLLETLKKDMLTSIDHSLKTNDSVPDVTEQYEEVKKICDKLNSPSRSANTGLKESIDSSSPSDKSMNPPINNKTPDVSSSEVISDVRDAVLCCKCSSIMTDHVSIPCGHSYCKLCINTYWAEPSSTGDYVCPRCKKSYPVRPELFVIEALSSVLKAIQRTDCSKEEPIACKRRKLADEEEGEMVSPASSPVQPQQDKPGDRRPQAEGGR